MVIDTSALMAILFRESDREAFADAIEGAPSRHMSVANWFETYMVAEARRHAAGLRELDRFMERANIQIVPVDVEQGRLARDCFSRFGKGRHRAGLNYGDCFAYALMSQLKEPLLFKGDDFPKTDAILVKLPTSGRAH
jgi:ribonuclease VapC